MIKNLNQLVQDFNTTPFLFVGSGLTRRYYNLPSWDELLEIFALQVYSDEFALSRYSNAANVSNPRRGINPKIAELIEMDFNKLWFNDKMPRKLDADYLLYIKDGGSPFKAEIAMYIKEHSIINKTYEAEINLLKELTKRSISGVITTNYDCFVESITNRYATFIGQEQLVFSSIQGIAEIYKIHGCITKPESIIINETDYINFDEKCSYLAAKLMTIFLEYPIVFIGYSITDPNIQRILKSIVDCLSVENLSRLGQRFIFIEYIKNSTNIAISDYTMDFDGKSISMTKVTLADFKVLYEALSKKKSAIPVKILRLFKQEFYDFTITNKPTANLRVASIDDSRIEDEELVLAIGRASDFGLKGLKGLSSDEWYRDIVMNDLEFTADEILEYAYTSSIARYNKLPVHKYLAQANNAYPHIEESIRERSFEDLISNSIKKERKKIPYTNRSILDIWNNINYNFEKKCFYIATLNEKEINVIDLENVLITIFVAIPNLFETLKQAEKTNLRRLIRIYDYLQYGKSRKSSS